nr:lipase/esterase AS-Trib20-ORF2 [uncultured bacterium]
MALHPQAQQLLDLLAQVGFADMATLTPAEARAQMDAFPRPEGDPVAGVADRTVPGPAGDIPVRVYTPEGAGRKPVVVFFHGGGWVIGSLDSHDATCRAVCNAAGAVVVSVDYRMAPEHKFPAAPDDCFAVTKWVAENAASIGADGARIAVAGDSAGGNLAAAVTLMARERGGPEIGFQALIYPVTDYSFGTPSYAENGEGYMLTKGAMEWFWGHYASVADAANPLASPLREKDLSGLPRALVITAGYDPLRDEGETYAKRLADAGVPVASTRYDGMIHGFFGNAALDDSTTAVNQVGAAIREAFALEPAR